jgi:UDP-glucose 4-epimerase
VRDLTYVDCVVDALLLAGVHPRAPGKIFNLGGEEPISLLDLAKTMIDVAGKGKYRFAAFPEERQKIDIGDYRGSISRILGEMGWRPKVSLRDGIRRTLEFFDQHKAVYIGI